MKTIKVMIWWKDNTAASKVWRDAREVMVWCRESNIPALCIQNIFELGSDRWVSVKKIKDDDPVGRFIIIRESDYPIVRLKFGDLVNIRPFTLDRTV